VGTLERQNNQTISVEETHELIELGSTVLSDVEKEIAVPGVNEQTTEVLKPMECVIISKSMVCIKEKFFSIPPDIEMIYIKRNKESGKDKLFRGQIITEESNHEKWVFQYEGKRYQRSYKARVKIESQYLIELDLHLHVKLLEEESVNEKFNSRSVKEVQKSLGSNYDELIVVENTENKGNQIKMASYDVPFVEETPMTTEYFKDSSEADYNHTQVIEEHVVERISRNPESQKDKKERIGNESLVTSEQKNEDIETMEQLISTIRAKSKKAN
jgi:hypothetical protein